MRPSLKIALLFAGVWFLGKMTFFYAQIFQDNSGVKFLVMWNILCLLLGMSIGTLIEKRREDRSQSTALGDIRKAMGGGMLYTVVVAGLLYLYYQKIDPAYNERQIVMHLERDQKMLDDPKQFAKVKKDNPDLQALTKQEILAKQKVNYSSVYSAGSTMTLSMLGMLLLTTINAIVLTVLYRRILFRQGTF